ncbi:MAG: HAMP domain-containing histidine kinase [Lachnospiraceae bacterium]|nr:HAMP domain-containing histidine kinase [Lachnospiraceae bacterium]
MKNKVIYKRYLTCVVFFAILFLIVISAVNCLEYRIYTKNYNKSISALVGTISEKYPDVKESDIMRILNANNGNADEMFERFGIDLEKQSAIEINDKSFYEFLIINFVIVIIGIICFVSIFIIYEKRKDKELKSITKYIEQINRRNYDLSIDTISEDELSILKNEIYKTTIMLKEVADNSNLDKVNLKKSLEDISHQLKTPLTSVLVMIDNLIDDPDMDSEVRQDFIRSIKRELVNIKFLVQEILKLSKFDSNTINFIKQDVEVKKIIEESMKNVSALCDLKNVKIEVDGNNNPAIYCDEKWQIEAVTNILKNCIDHSKEGSKIHVNYDDNNVYSMIKIVDEGGGISKKDLPHIFERFYKGDNAVTDSLGIGLALAKTIVEQDNGMISVDSDDKGSTFTIKYFDRTIVKHSR